MVSFRLIISSGKEELYFIRICIFSRMRCLWEVLLWILMAVSTPHNVTQRILETRVSSASYSIPTWQILYVKLTKKWGKFWFLLLIFLFNLSHLEELPKVYLSSMGELSGSFLVCGYSVQASILSQSKNCRVLLPPPSLIPRRCSVRNHC